MNTLILKRSLSVLAGSQSSAAAATCSASSSTKSDKCVLISQSTNIHRNLALEDWLYRNGDFTHQKLLLLWKNDPAVVIGRHQNIWSEVNVEHAENNQIRLARRNSGGGTVYHDQGNLNCTFFTTRKEYCREKNLKLVSSALDRGFGIKTQISAKHDLTFNVENGPRKVTPNGSTFVSGTASKLGNNAYHHLTLLLDVDLNALHTLLNPPNVECIDSNATKSVRSPVVNLREHEPKINVENALETLGYEFLRTDENGGDGGQELIKKQRGFQMINPSNEWFPGIDKICTDLKGWEWNFAKSPAFAIRKTYTEPEYPTNLKLELQITKGLVESINVENSGQLDSVIRTDIDVYTNAVRGKPFSNSVLEVFEGLLLKKSVRAFDGVDRILFKQPEEELSPAPFMGKSGQSQEDSDVINFLSRQTMCSL